MKWKAPFLSNWINDSEQLYDCKHLFTCLVNKIENSKTKVKNKEKQCTYNVIIKISNKPLNTEHLKLKMY